MSGFRIVNGEIVKEGIWPGDVIVSGTSGKRYKVTKVNLKNLRCIDTDGNQWNVNKLGARKADDQSWDGPREKTEYEKYMDVVDSGITLGTVVEFTRPADQRKFPGCYVVCNIPNTDGRMRVAKLGGDGGRYVRCSISAVKVVGV